MLEKRRLERVVLRSSVLLLASTDDADLVGVDGATAADAAAGFSGAVDLILVVADPVPSTAVTGSSSRDIDDVDGAAPLPSIGVVLLFLSATGIIIGRPLSSTAIIGSSSILVCQLCSPCLPKSNQSITSMAYIL